MQRFLRIFLSTALSLVLASVAALCVGLKWQNVGLAILVFVPVFIFALWRSLNAASTTKAAGTSLQLTGLLLVALPFSIVAASVAVAMGAFGASSGYAGGAIALGLVAIVVLGFIILVPAGAATALIGTYLRLKKQKPIPETSRSQDSR